jgi:hypothetical protein
MKAYKVTVTDTVTLLVAADDINRPVYLHNNTNETLYIGGSDVSVEEGFPILKHSAPLAGGLPPKVPLYGIAESGKSLDIRVIIPPTD